MLKPELEEHLLAKERGGAYEERDGVRIRVVYLPETGKVIIVFPD